MRASTLIVEVALPTTTKLSCLISGECKTLLQIRNGGVVHHRILAEIQECILSCIPKEANGGRGSKAIGL